MGGQGEQGWRKGLPGVEDGCVLSREGGGDGSWQAGEGLSVKRTPAGEVGGVVRDLSPPPGQQGGTAAALLMPRMRQVSLGMDLTLQAPCYWAPRGSHMPQAAVAAVQVQMPEAPSIFLSGSELIFLWQDMAGA